jgi:hypothetical protein
MKLSVLATSVFCIHIAFKATTTQATDGYHCDMTCRKRLNLNARFVPLDLNASRDTTNNDDTRDDEEEMVEGGRGSEYSLSYNNDNGEDDMEDGSCSKYSSSYKNDNREDDNRNQILSCYEPPIEDTSLLSICETIKGGTKKDLDEAIVLIEDIIGIQGVDRAEIARLLRILIDNGADRDRVLKLIGVNIKLTYSAGEDMSAKEDTSSYWQYASQLYTWSTYAVQAYNFHRSVRNIIGNQEEARSTPKSTSSAACNIAFYAVGLPDPGVCAALNGWDPADA